MTNARRSFSLFVVVLFLSNGIFAVNTSSVEPNASEQEIAVFPTDGPEIVLAIEALNEVRQSYRGKTLSNTADINEHVEMIVEEFRCAPKIMMGTESFTELNAHDVWAFLLRYLATIIHIDESDKEVNDASLLMVFGKAMNRAVEEYRVVATSLLSRSKRIAKFEDLALGFPIHELRMYYLLASRKFGDRITGASDGLFGGVTTTMTNHHRQLHELFIRFGPPAYFIPAFTRASPDARELH